jgi:hypothetical protein
MAVSRFRPSTQELCMDISDFQKMDFDQVCKILKIKVPK